jgi:iron complex transport system substrate-binding protein
MSVNKFLFLIFLLSCIYSCRQSSEKTVFNEEISLKTTDSVVYAKLFRIESFKNYKKVAVFNPWNEKIIQTYILVPKNIDLPVNLPKGILIRTPLERTIAYNSVQCSYFEELGVLNTLVGVCEPHQIRLKAIADAVRNKQIADLGMAANPDIEKIILAEPEASFVTPIEGSEYGAGVTQLDIPMIECLDYMETSPLSRAEWIRFIALFFEKTDEGDSIFKATVECYNNLKASTAMCLEKPTVFSEIMYSGIWYLPAGRSYMAKLFADAGAEYIWKNDNKTGSLGLPFEEVLDKAVNADFWLIKYSNDNPLTYTELEANNKGYTLFYSFKNRKVFACNTLFLPYYEDVAIHPERVLKDLISIFHPELFPNYNRIYYEAIP